MPHDSPWPLAARARARRSCSRCSCSRSTASRRSWASSAALAASRRGTGRSRRSRDGCAHRDDGTPRRARRAAGARRGWWGMAMLIASEATLFGGPHRHVLLPPLQTAALAAAGDPEPEVAVAAHRSSRVLAATSVPMQLAGVAARGGPRSARRGSCSSSRSSSRPATSRTQVHDFARPARSSTPITADAYSSIYYTLLGADHAHVFVGLLFNALAAREARARPDDVPAERDRRSSPGTGTSSTSSRSSSLGDAQLSAPRMSAAQRLGSLQWIGLLVGAGPGPAQHVVGFGVTQADCSAGGSRLGDRDRPLAGRSLMAVAVALVAGRRGGGGRRLRPDARRDFGDGPPRRAPARASAASTSSRRRRDGRERALPDDHPARRLGRRSSTRAARRHEPSA